MSLVNKKIKDVRTLKKITGFDINKYSDLHLMNDSQMLTLIYNRVSFREKLDQKDWFWEHFNYDIDVLNSITKEQLTDGANKWVKEKRKKIMMAFECPLKVDNVTNKHSASSINDISILSLSHGDGVHPMDRGDVIAFARSQAINGFGSGLPFMPSREVMLQLEEDDNFPFDDFLCESADLLVKKDTYNNSRGHFVIDFDYSDSELITSFASQISKWRKELNIHDVPTTKSWEYIKGRILDYKVIPLLDLVIYAEFFGVKIPSRVLALALFPDGERDGFGISQTVVPFIEKHINSSSINYYKLKISS